MSTFEIIARSIPVLAVVVALATVVVKQITDRPMRKAFELTFVRLCNTLANVTVPIVLGAVLAAIISGVAVGLFATTELIFHQELAALQAFFQGPALKNVLVSIGAISLLISYMFTWIISSEEKKALWSFLKFHEEKLPTFVPFA